LLIRNFDASKKKVHLVLKLAATKRNETKKKTESEKTDARQTNPRFPFRLLLPALPLFLILCFDWAPHPSHDPHRASLRPTTGQQYLRALQIDRDELYKMSLANSLSLSLSLSLSPLFSLFLQPPTTSLSLWGLVINSVTHGQILRGRKRGRENKLYFLPSTCLCLFMASRNACPVPFLFRENSFYVFWGSAKNENLVSSWY
jgi:hypothetical protein